MWYPSSQTTVLHICYSVVRHTNSNLKMMSFSFSQCVLLEIGSYIIFSRSDRSFAMLQIKYYLQRMRKKDNKWRNTPTLLDLKLLPQSKLNTLVAIQLWVNYTVQLCDFNSHGKHVMHLKWPEEKTENLKLSFIWSNSLTCSHVFCEN